MAIIRFVCIVLLCLPLTACGVKRPLMRPKDIPAYEEQQRKKRERIEQEQREMQQEISPTQGTH